MSTGPVRKAVIPAAGLGTRLLPATKVIPKELIPLLDKPTIHYAVEEAVASGIESIVIVTSERKTAILDYFRPDPFLQQFLLARGKTAEASLAGELFQSCSIEAVYQNRPGGLGQAVLYARDAVGDEPFAVLLPDVVMLANPPCTRQLISCFERLRGGVVAAREVESAELSRFGIVARGPALSAWNTEVFRITGLVEKPDHNTAPSHFGVFGRYVLEPAIFEYLAATEPYGDGEIQLTAALARYAAEHALYGYCFKGDHFDTGDKFGLFRAALELVLRDSAMRQQMFDYLRSRCAELSYKVVS